MFLFSQHRKPLTAFQEWIVLFACLWFEGGLFVDGWAHNHIPELETFFTPWHGIFYSGFFAVTLTLLAFTWHNRKSGLSWHDAIPAHYEWALAGCAIFLLGGIGDLLWHQLLGIEANLEALLSPTHLILGTGLTLMVSGPLRSWWKQTGQRETLGAQLPMLLSLTMVLSLLTFLTQYGHFVDKGPGGLMPDTESLRSSDQSIAFLGYQLQTIILMGGMFFTMQRTRLAFGFLTILLTVNTFAMSMMRVHTEFTAAALVAGIIGDGMLQIVYVQKNIRAALRVFAFAFPATLYALIMLTTAAGQGMWWSVHMWTGAIVIPGFTGLLLSFVAWPLEEA